MKREAFRAKIEAELISYGYRPGSFIWQQGPSRLVLVLDGQLREIPIKATMRKEALAYELGRLKGWAEILGLTPAANVSRPKTLTKPRQIDLEEAIEARA
jgi:hypothetical protein